MLLNEQAQEAYVRLAGTVALSVHSVDVLSWVQIQLMAVTRVLKRHGRPKDWHTRQEKGWLQGLALQLRYMQCFRTSRGYFLERCEEWIQQGELQDSQEQSEHSCTTQCTK